MIHVKLRTETETFPDLAADQIDIRWMMIRIASGTADTPQNFKKLIATAIRQGIEMGYKDGYDNGYDECGKEYQERDV